MPKVISISEVKNRIKRVHGCQYSYPDIEKLYKSLQTYINIYCPEHGVFKQQIRKHLEGQNCPKCSYLKKSKNYLKSPDVFFDEVNDVHNFRYDYKNLDMYYKGSFIPIPIYCKVHGVFWQSPNDHLKGCGCPKCSCSKGELAISKTLDELNIDYKMHHSFNECKNVQVLHFDFYIKSKKVLIEYDGIQHFKPVEHFGGQRRYLKQIKNDILKNEFIRKSDYSLLRIPYWDYDKIDSIIKENI